MSAETAILLAAERPFALQGIGAASLRRIGKAAGRRDTTAVQYHFTGEDALIRAVFRYRLEAVGGPRRRPRPAPRIEQGAVNKGRSAYREKEEEPWRMNPGGAVDPSRPGVPRLGAAGAVLSVAVVAVSPPWWPRSAPRDCLAPFTPAGTAAGTPWRVAMAVRR
ncbi:TetR family transcriptional regulator [Nocardiopsis potens]|uniref:TetR family transcriptional regulator n=1 Tax=Nocardiopsis potens TaxID=1246458 RepID=UPI000347CF6E|nr:TetR family transcriptional regulator [Nocardiopsis potens]